jgi:hypothetical protein
MLVYETKYRPHHFGRGHGEAIESRRTSSSLIMSRSHAALFAVHLALADDVLVQIFRIASAREQPL